MVERVAAFTRYPGRVHRVKILESLCMFPSFWSWDNLCSTNSNMQTCPVGLWCDIYFFGVIFLGWRLRRGCLACPSLACSFLAVLIYFSISIYVLGHTDSLVMEDHVHGFKTKLTYSLMVGLF